MRVLPFILLVATLLVVFLAHRRGEQAMDPRNNRYTEKSEAVYDPFEEMRNFLEAECDIDQPLESGEVIRTFRKFFHGRRYSIIPTFVSGHRCYRVDIKDTETDQVLSTGYSALIDPTLMSDTISVATAKAILLLVPGPVSWHTIEEMQFSGEVKQWSENWQEIDSSAHSDEAGDERKVKNIKGVEAKRKRKLNNAA